MIGLDTSVLVRFLVQDDPDQSRRAGDLIGSLTAAEPGFVSREVMVELVWVLERAYGHRRSDIVAALTQLLEAEELVIEVSGRVGQALYSYDRGGPGFADQMIRLAGLDAGCTAPATFDKAAATAPGVRLLQARQSRISVTSAR